MPYCPNCGTENEAGDAFCDSCGARRQGEALPPATAVRQGRSRPLLGAALLVVAVAAVAIAVYFAVGRDGDSSQSLADGDQGTRPVATASPTRRAGPEPTATIAGVSPSPATPTLEPTGEPPAVSGHDSPEAAIADWVEPREYAGDCSTTSVEEDVGKVCSSLFGGSGSELVFVVGLTFSEFTEWLLVEQQNDESWLVVDSAPVLGDAAEPPWPVAPEPTTRGYDIPEQAIAAYLDWYGLGYVGDCEYADLDTDIGLYCSVLWEDRGDRLIFAAGLAFSEPDTWLLLAFDSETGGWQVADAAEFAAGPQDSVPPWP